LWISCPKKFSAPLNFAFALWPMGRKISNHLYSTFQSCFRLMFSCLRARRRECLFWIFRKIKFPVTRFLSIKLACWNFHSSCRDDGANWLMSHQWLWRRGAGGAKYGVNLGIFKNHSGGARGGQISPDRSQIYIHDGGSPLRNSA